MCKSFEKSFKTNCQSSQKVSHQVCEDFYSVFCGTVWQTVQFHLLHTCVLGEKSFFKKKKKEITLFSICLSSCEISALMRQQCACSMHLLLIGEMQAVVTNPIQKTSERGSLHRLIP